MGGKRASGKHYTSVGKFPAIGKKFRKYFKRCQREEVNVRSIMAKADYENGKISDKALKKLKFERNVSNYARNFYNKHDGKIGWARIVQAVRLGQPLQDDFKAKLKDSRNEKPKFEIKFKKSDIEKYYKIYPEFVPVIEKPDNRKSKKD